jgi:hypothetical protein
MTATHATVRSMTITVRRVGHILFIDNFFSPPDLFDSLHTRAINCCGAVRQNHKEIPRGFDNKTLKLEHSDICARVRGN